MKYFWKHWFLPLEKNNHRAALLRTNTLLILIAFYLFNHSLIKFISVVKPDILGYSSEITVQKVIDQTNKKRQELGLTPLKYNSLLSQSATKKAQDMFTNNYWAHTSPTGTTPWDFIKSIGYKYSAAGENLARDFYDTDSLIKAWMNSPTHRDNIVNSKYQEIGIGVVNGTLGGVKTTLVVQHFGTPLIAVLPESQEKIPEKKLEKQEEVITPEIPEVISLPQTPEVLAQEKKLINPLTLNKIISLILFGLIIAVLFIDGFVTLKNNHLRLTGSNIGHIGFLFVILLLIITSQQGAIF